MKKHLKTFAFLFFVASAFLLLWLVMLSGGEQTYVGKGNSGKGIEIERPKQYAAIALSNMTQAWGSSVNYTTQSGAERDAIKRCKEGGAKDCNIVLSFNNTCGALAIKHKTDGKNNGGWGSSTGNKENAEKWALERCGYYGGDRCKIIESICSQ